MRVPYYVRVCVSLIYFVSLMTSSFSQVAINDNGSAPAATAMLDVNVFGVNKKGMLVPRMTTAERVAIPAPANSLLVYDTNTSSFWFFITGTGWRELIGTNNNPWTRSGNNIYNNNTGNVGIATGASINANFHVGTGRTVLFGDDSLSSTTGNKFIWFGTKGAVRFANIGLTGNDTWDYANIGQNSIGIGEGAKASGPQSFSQGYFSSANAFYSFARGFAVTANGDHSFINAWNSNVNGIGSAVFGDNTGVAGDWSISSGYDNRISGDYSGTFGIGLHARAYNAFIVGRYNDSAGTSSSTTWVATDPLFVVGNGSGNATRSNALTVLKNGNLGVGNATPADLLHVGTTTGATLRIGSLETLEDAGANRMAVNVAFSPTTDGNLTLGTAAFRWLTVFAVNGAINTSDARDKRNISKLSYGLDALMKLNPVSFEWNRSDYGDGKKLGLIAQEVLQVIPEVVVTHENTITDEKSGATSKSSVNRYGIYYSDLVPVLIKSIQEQQTIIDNQKQKIEDLERRLQAIEAKLK